MLGVFFGFFAVSLGSHFSVGVARDAFLLSLLAVWVALCSFVRAISVRNGYAGFVAAFTAGIVLAGLECGGMGSGACADDEAQTLGVTTITLDRIQMTLIGIAATLASSALIFPVHSPSLVQAQLCDAIDELRSLFATTHTAWLAHSLAEELGPEESSVLQQTRVAGAVRTPRRSRTGHECALLAYSQDSLANDDPPADRDSGGGSTANSRGGAAGGRNQTSMGQGVELHPDERRERQRWDDGRMEGEQQQQQQQVQEHRQQLLPSEPPTVQVHSRVT